MTIGEIDVYVQELVELEEPRGLVQLAVGELQQEHVHCFQDFCLEEPILSQGLLDVRQCQEPIWIIKCY